MKFKKIKLIFLCLSVSLLSHSVSAIKDNTEPTADAGNTQFTKTGETIKLNGSNSTDTDGERLSYHWELVTKPKSSMTHIDDPNNVTPEIFIDSQGTYQIELKVDDGISESTTSIVEISTIETKPIVSKINNKKITTGSAVLLKQHAFDPDGDKLSFKWQLLQKPSGSHATLAENDSNIIELIADKAGVYLIGVNTSDGKQNFNQQFRVFAIDEFSVTNRSIGCVLDLIFYDGFDAAPINNPPIANVGEDQTGVIGQIIDLDGSQSFDIDLDDLTYQWSLLSAPQSSQVSIVNDTNINAELNPDVAGNYVAQLMVNDGCLDSDPDSALVTISVNQPPVIDSEPGLEVFSSQGYSYQVTATDPEDHEISYSLMTSPSAMTIDTNGLINWQATEANIYPVVVKVTDQYDASTTQSFDIEVSDNQPPVINSEAITAIVTNQPLVYQVLATDPEDHELTYSLMSSPDGMLIDDTGLITWQTNVADNYAVVIKVTDEFDAFVTQSFDLIVSENQAPVFNSVPVLDVFPTITYTYQVTASDPDGHDFSYSLDNFPAGMTITSTGLISWQASSEGNYPVTIKLEDQYGASNTQSFQIEVRVNQAPIITSSAITQAVVNESYSYQVIANDPEGHNISYSLLNAPNEMMIDTQGLISWNIDMSGTYPVTVRVEDIFGAFSTQAFSIEVNINQSPQINSQAITDVIEAHLYEYSVMASDPEGHPLTYSLNNAPAGMMIDENGLISWVALAPNIYTVEVMVEDNFGGSDTQNFDVNVTKNNPPVIQSWPISEGEKGNKYTYQITATEQDGDPISYSLVNPPQGMTILATGELDWTPQETGIFSIEIMVDDGVNATDTQTFNLTINELPPNPSDIATPLSRTEYTPFNDGIKFLYLNEPPVQLGMPLDTIEDFRAAVITGTILNENNGPLPGVKVTINNHGEYGHTLTGNDGTYFMVVNGGGTVTVNFSKGGYLDVQRDVQTPWEEYAYVDDSILVRLDDKVTTVDLADTTDAYQVARANNVIDADGSRQATILFPSGTTALMRMADGSSQNISELNVRATEYTVGENGPKRMPADLPAGSAYTYAIELSVDEAIELDASSVEFSQDVIFYLENFIGFPAGVDVPLGWYDKNLGYWTPSDNGIVIDILSIENGKAIIDITADIIGNAANQLQLDELGINDNELIQLAQLYSAGTTLWRVPIPHFTPWDCNWPYTPPENIEEPPEQENIEDLEEIEENDNECEGCTINPQDRTLEQDIPIVGTSIGIKYSSQNHTRKDKFNFKITDETPPDSLEKIELELKYGGRSEVISFQAIANLNYQFDWINRDVFDRQIHSANVTYDLKYTFPAMYNPNVSEFNRVFGRVFSNGPFDISQNRVMNTVSTSRNGNAGSFVVGSSPTVGTRNNEDELKDQKQEQLQLGGWEITNHHFYDPANQTLFQGDGFERLVAASTATIGDIPQGSLSYGHGGYATAAPGGSPRAISIAPNGDVYFTDNYNSLIRRVTPDGTIFTVAGGAPDILCAYQAAQDAMEICLQSVTALTVHENGEVYFGNRFRIRKIGLDGVATTIAGTGDPEFNGDDIPALSAGVIPVDLAFDKNGNLLVLEPNRLRKIDAQGIITTIAGMEDLFGGESGDGECFFEPCEVANGVPAIESSLSEASGMSIGDDGTIYIADSGHNCIREITPDGYIYQYFNSEECIAEIEFRGSDPVMPIDVEVDDQGNLLSLNSDGVISKSFRYATTEILNDNVSGFGGDDEDFSIANLNRPERIEFSPLSGLFIADTANARIRRVTDDNIIYTYAGSGDLSSLTVVKSHYLSAAKDKKNTSDNIFIATRDGRALFEFSKNGVHLKTLDAITAKVLWEFIYHDDGSLAKIIDRNNLTIEINRDTDGFISSIVSPYGKTTRMKYDSSNLLEKVYDPSDNFWAIEYNDGLLTAFNDRNDNRYEYTYSTNGNLISDLNPIGGGWTVDTVETTSSPFTKTTMVTGEGRESSFTKDSKFLGTQFVEVKPDGTLLNRIFSSNGEMLLINADRSEYKSQSSAHPRFGNQVRFTSGSQMRSNLTGIAKETNTSVEIIESVVTAGTIAPVNQSVITTNINGYNWVSEFNQSFGVEKGYKTMSPEGRVTTRFINDNLDLKSVTTTGFESQRFEYDENRRVQSIIVGTGAEARETQFSYYESGPMNGELHTITNPIGLVTSFEYDNNQRIIKKTLPDLREINYAYDANGNMISLKPAGKPVHHFKYNGLNQQNRYEPPELPNIIESDTSYEFNLDSQITKIIRADGQEINFSYNAETGKLESKTIPTGTFTYTYDYELNPVGAQIGSGKLINVVAPSGITLDFTFDGFLPLSTTWSGDITGVVSKSYDDLFRLSSITINDADSINYAYDNDNFLILAGDLIINREVQKAGVISGSTLDNISTLNSYSDFAELESYTAQFNNSDIYNVSFVRDKLGRITKKTETIDSVEIIYEYEYDLAGRLIEEKTDSVITDTWDYDDNGNRTTNNGSVIAFFDDQDRLISNNGVSYIYNDYGELTSKTFGNDTTLYHYDVLGNLLSVTKPDGTFIEYIIDPRGRRVGKKINGTLTKGWLYKDKLSPIAELDGAGNLVTRFIYGEKDNIPSYLIRSGVKYRVISNELGSPIMIVNSLNGTVLQQLKYDSWGNILNDSNPGFQPFGFAGGHYDHDTSLIRFGFRDYDPETGVWLRKDLIRFLSGDTNMYRYAHGDPINKIDPLGLFVVCSYQSEKVRCTDIDTGETVTADATSGGEPYGDPLPTSYYEILDQAQNTESFRLDAIDENPRDDTHDETGRTHFRIHEPGNTIGCIAITNQEQWDELRELFNNTKTGSTNDNFSPWWKFWGDDETITRFGILQVIDD